VAPKRNVSFRTKLVDSQTARLELATSAVTVQQPEVTSCNFTAPITTLGALRNPRDVLLHPNCTQILRETSQHSAFVSTNPTCELMTPGLPVTRPESAPPPPQS